MHGTVRAVGSVCEGQGDKHTWMFILSRWSVVKMGGGVDVVLWWECEASVQERPGLEVRRCWAVGCVLLFLSFLF